MLIVFLFISIFIWTLFCHLNSSNRSYIVIEHTYVFKYASTSWQLTDIHTYFFSVVLCLIVSVTDRFSSCLIFRSDILFINCWLITSITDSLFINDQATLIFFNQMMMNIEIISSSFFSALMIIMSALTTTSLIVSFACVLLTLYLRIDDWRFHANSFLNCWFSFSSWLIDKLIIRFIIFCISNLFLFFMTLIEFDTFHFLNVINSFTCSFIIFTLFVFDLLFTLIDSSFEYSIICISSFSFSNSWNFSCWFILDIFSIFVVLLIFFLCSVSRFCSIFSCTASWLLRYLSCSSLIFLFLFSIVFFFLAYVVVLFFRISSLLVVAAIIWSSNTHSTKWSCLFFCDNIIWVVINDDLISLDCLEFEHSLT